ncbi:S-layer protein [Lentilactobacillus buchneri]|uniref:S-layer protein n=1 Tax=Lentilactobacillus buchneri TaxID=1581 RepID=UPI001CDBC80D|nr:S-layer protein [Lentilactobacillus buchneri]
MKGAKTVATKTTLAGLKNSKQGQKNFRAYRVATTNRGSVYYKVVSFDKTYRGWIYGGKSVTAFAGGIAQYSTTNAPAAANTSSSASSASINTQGQTTALTDAQKNATYKITKAGTANDGTATTYTYPAWTQYKKGRTVTDATPYANDTFKVTDATTRTREGDLWVKIQDTNATNGQKINGWILYSALSPVSETPTTPTTDSKSLNINYTDATGKVVGTYKYTEANAVQGSTPEISVANLIRNIKGNVPSGYTITNNIDQSTSALYGQLSLAKFGQSFTVPVSASQTLTASQLETIFNKLVINFEGTSTNPAFSGAANNNTPFSTWLTADATRFANGKSQQYLDAVRNSFKNNATLQAVANNGNGTVTQAQFVKALTDAFKTTGVTDGAILVAHDNNGKGGNFNTVDALSLDYAGTRSTITLDPNAATGINLYFAVDNNGGNGFAATNPTITFHGDYGQNNWTYPASTPVQANTTQK